MLTLRFSVLTLSLSVLTLYMLFLHERTVSSVTDVTVVLQLFLRIYVYKIIKTFLAYIRVKVIKVLSQLSRRRCRVYLKQLRLNLIQVFPFVRTQQGVAVNIRNHVCQMPFEPANMAFERPEMPF